jgi:hypothetical protein
MSVKPTPTEKVAEKMRERAEAKEEGKKLGGEVLDNLYKRKELEMQLTLLQNRIKKL